MPTKAWKTGTPYAQLKRYTFWSFVAIGALPTLFVVIFWDQVDAAQAPWYLAYAVAVTALAVVAVRVGWNLTLNILEEEEFRPGLIWLLVALVIVALVAVLPATPVSQEPGIHAAAMFVLLVAGLVVLALSPGLWWYWSALLIAICAVAVAATWQLSAQQTPDPPALADAQWFPAMFSTTLMLGGLAAAMRMSVWMVDRVREEEQASAVRADLAVAEERLRFSRDLHDIFGRTLTAVALKSDLAAELAEAGRTTEAATEMREVHHLSEEALREVRSVVAGYREINLATELAGARAVLQSAGVRARLVGSAATVPPEHAGALAWVVREGVTNVLRHSSATTCTLDLSVDDDGTSVLTITNDGARAPAVSGGSGLRGLADRLRPLQGVVTHELVGDEFVLRAEIPPTMGAAVVGTPAIPAEAGPREAR